VVTAVKLELFGWAVRVRELAEGDMGGLFEI
jgi:hypothetical protein